MKRILGQSPGADRIKAAYYSPKAFRGAHVRPPEDAAGPSRVGRWVLGGALAAACFAAGHYWPREGVAPPAPGAVPAALVGVPQAGLPPTGILAAAAYPPSTDLAPVKIIGPAGGTSCIAELARWDGGQLALQVFVRSREAVESQLPLGRYRGTITCGSRWYGAGRFGPTGTRTLVASPFVLERTAAGALQGVAVDLTPRFGGNLPLVRLD